MNGWSHQGSFHMNRRHATIAIAALCAAGPFRALAGSPVEGKEFTALRDAQPATIPGKIEVVEFFSYACPACNAFDPALEQWRTTLPPDVGFRRVPVPYLDNAENFQRTYFALEATGMLASVHGKVFAAVHVEKRRLAKPDEIADVVARAGGDRAKFLAAFSSFSASSFVARAKASTSAHHVESIPALAVAGRFLTSPRQAGSPQEALAVAAFLVDKARKG